MQMMNRAYVREMERIQRREVLRREVARGCVVAAAALLAVSFGCLVAAANSPALSGAASCVLISGFWGGRYLLTRHAVKRARSNQ